MQAPAGQQSQSVAVNFVSDGVRTMAEPGENLWAVAQKCDNLTHSLSSLKLAGF